MPTRTLADSTMVVATGGHATGTEGASHIEIPTTVDLLSAQTTDG
jgi:hypothetical protein